MREFMECDTCREKPGSPPLCRGCLHNRRLIQELVGMLKPFSEIPRASPYYPYTLCQQVKEGPYHLRNPDINRVREFFTEKYEGLIEPGCKYLWTLTGSAANVLGRASVEITIAEVNYVNGRIDNIIFVPSRDPRAVPRFIVDEDEFREKAKLAKTL